MIFVKMAPFVRLLVRKAMAQEAFVYLLPQRYI